MTEFQPIARLSNTAKVTLLSSILISVLALAAALWIGRTRNIEPSQGAAGVDLSLSSVIKSGVLRVGYGSFPPYTSVDLTESDPSLRIKGFSIDVVKEIARRSVPPLKLEFIQFSWDSLKPEVEAGKFDFVADPVFQTIPRAADFRLSRPYSYFGIAVALVRKDETRFKDFSDLDKPDITIALAEGWTSSEFARQNLRLPKFSSIPVTGDGFAQLDQVRLGRADVALNDVPTVAQYVKAHQDTVKALWLASPPSSVPGSFLLKKDSRALAEFLDSAVEILIADGTLLRLDEKWKAYGAIPILGVRPGAGLR